MDAYELFAAGNEGLGQLFQQRMLEDPRATAIFDAGKRMTYSELHDQATVLAHKLYEKPFTIEEPVGILVKHGMLDAVAQLGVLYAGGTCVPFDAALPDVQIERRLNRIGARYIILDSHNSSRNLPFTQIAIDEVLGCPLGKFTTSTYPVLTGPEHRTHVIFTSGTTAEPKAVQIVARSIVHLSQHVPFEPLLQSDVVAHVNSTSFDVSLVDIWAPLLQGACIAVLDRSTVLDLDALYSAIRQLGISVVVITTPLANLVATTKPDLFHTLRIVIIGGEVINVSAIRKIFEAGPPGNMINAYGPTECCAYCLARKITPQDLDYGEISIGEPIGSNVAVVYDDGRCLNDDEEGELLVGGPGVSPGYFDSPGANREAFTEVPDLVDAKGNPYRMYHTGDIVRRRPNGQHDFVSRRDHQVKVRGYRIELSAVESALMDTGCFAQAVALRMESRVNGAGSALVAFTVLSPSAKDSAVADATAALKAVLPHYMVPQIRLVDRIPLNNHVKVDRKQLEDIYYSQLEDQDPLDTPCAKGSTRDRLLALWRYILAIHGLEISDEDNFFQLGGTSLQAALLISEVRRSFNTEISLLALYDNPTLSQLTTLLETHRGQVLDTVRNQQDEWIEDSMIGDKLESVAGPVVDWREDTEGRVFLTGATGFVGAFLLADLLKMPSVHQVACLVRAPSTATGFQRLVRALQKYELWQSQYGSKLLVLCGTLESPWLGLGERRFREIAQWASVVFHLGALVNYTQPYSWHRPANIEGTVNVARLAVTGRPKGLHYCSSVSCFGPTGILNGTRIIYENEDPLLHVNALEYDHGYAQSQWVAEQLLRRLVQRGFPTAIYRPGFITGHSTTGACNPDDFFSRFVRTCLGLGCYPKLPNQSKEFVPVDHVTSAMLHISSSVFSLGHTYHLVPPIPEQSIDIDGTMELLAEATGAPIECISYSEWVERLSAVPDTTLQPLLPMLTEKVRDGKTRWEMYENMPTYDSTNTKRALAGCSDRIVFPALDVDLMKKYLDFLSRQ
ncbi:non-ribosomal peptide synthetase [Aspergillus undulatus]|uniref:non-ribosomal peptide synthetase n=1 Tax=Aspergillus undulatus TaxID=1810928 RepID=UPI003CCD0E6C